MDTAQKEISKARTKYAKAALLVMTADAANMKLADASGPVGKIMARYEKQHAVRAEKRAASYEILKKS